MSQTTYRESQLQSLQASRLYLQHISGKLFVRFPAYTYLAFLMNIVDTFIWFNFIILENCRRSACFFFYLTDYLVKLIAPLNQKKSPLKYLNNEYRTKFLTFFILFSLTNYIIINFPIYQLRLGSLRVNFPSENNQFYVHRSD